MLLYPQEKNIYAHYHFKERSDKGDLEKLRINRS